ncbi:PrgI family protein [Embleya sp. NBC_00896]|uniref:PrgI family protein n=1 Tax=Embleya sp. NBC_00896 TaxID=2975961 RepID=UPI002F918726|nr:PrgI family protein [Embleya sp. NBC_00896]
MRTAPDDDEYETVRIPSDIEREDKLLGPLTARQIVIFAAATALLWGGYHLTRAWLAPLVYIALTAPTALLLIVVVLGQRDGVSLDKWLRAGLRHLRAPKRLAPPRDPDDPRDDALPDWLQPDWAKQAAPQPAPLRMPVRDVADTGVVDLGDDGHALIAACSTVNLALRTGAEQQSLLGGFGRFLNALTGPTQIVVRAERMDMEPYLYGMRERAPGLPHPALEESALAHADFVEDLAADRDLLVRQVLLVQREPGRPNGRADQRVMEAARALGAAGVAVTGLSGPRAREVIASAADPGYESTAGLHTPSGTVVGTHTYTEPPITFDPTEDLDAGPVPTRRRRQTNGRTDR